MPMDRRPISTSMSRCLGYTAPRRASGLLVSVRTIGVSAHHSRSNTREEAASCRRQSTCQSRIKLEWRSNEALTAMLQIFRCDPCEFRSWPLTYTFQRVQTLLATPRRIHHSGSTLRRCAGHHNGAVKTVASGTQYTEYNNG